MSSLLGGLAGGVEYSKDASGKVAFQAALDFFGGFTFGQGWVYLATIIDLGARMVIGWPLAHMRTSLVIDALNMARTHGTVA